MKNSRIYNLSISFEEISVSLSKVILKRQNIIIMRDFNIDLKIQGRFQIIFFNLLKLTDLIKSETCFAKSHKSVINLVSTNKLLSFQIRHLTEYRFVQLSQTHLDIKLDRENFESS